MITEEHTAITPSVAIPAIERLLVAMSAANVPHFPWQSAFSVTMLDDGVFNAFARDVGSKSRKHLVTGLGGGMLVFRSLTAQIGGIEFRLTTESRPVTAMDLPDIINGTYKAGSER